MRKRNRVEIEWEDSIGAGGWFVEGFVEEDRKTFVERTAGDHSMCYTAGYVVVRNKAHVVIAQSIHGENYGALLSIPRRMIRTIRKF